MTEYVSHQDEKTFQQCTAVSNYRVLSTDSKKQERDLHCSSPSSF